MAEKEIFIKDIPLVELYGINDSKMGIIKEHFPNIKIVARGDALRITGEENDLEALERKIYWMMEHFRKYHALNEIDIDRIIKSPGHGQETAGGTTDENIIVYGNNGVVVRARTPNQLRMVQSSYKSDLMFAVGPAGTGKTYTAVALAVRAMKNKEVRKIILTRPAVEAGENLGFLPGDLKEKLDPYLQPLYDALFDMLPADKLTNYLENKIIEVAPLAFMRGRTLNNAFVILDEAQNATESQMKMFLTRMGSSAKFIVTGDVTQTDLPFKQPSGLTQAIKIFNNVPGIDIIHLDVNDVVRHKLVRKILSIYDTETALKLQTKQ
ncbi:MAG TPA: PhoH family protein [Bacteroidia bacterium]|jgi:phosphate starvation-inducible PhoH-like protein|nr:PhoH family protein [Bacteroidia bacterium]